MANAVGINRFFSEVLGAPFHDPRKSWGAMNGNRVFLRVGDHEVVQDDDGIEWTLIHAPEWGPSFGQRERQDHLNLIRPGHAFAVVYRMNSENKIIDYDDQQLLVLGEIVKEGRRYWARVLRRIKPDEVKQASSDTNSLAADLTAIIAGGLPSTEKEALVKARIGQGMFRSRVLQLWESRCAVSGVAVPEAIRASHIKPWKDCTDVERLDPYNGLPLVATLDALFDAGLIAFDSAGRMLISSRLPVADKRKLGLHGTQPRGRPHAKTITYLRQHLQRRYSP